MKTFNLKGLVPSLSGLLVSSAVAGLLPLSGQAASAQKIDLRLKAPSSPAAPESAGGGGAEEMLRSKQAPANAPGRTGYTVLGEVDCRDSAGRKIDPQDAAFVGCQRSAVELNQAQASLYNTNGVVGVFPGIPFFSHVPAKN